MPQPKFVSITYVGPPGQTSDRFGALEPGAVHDADAEFAAYLVRAHPDYWQLVTRRPAASPTTPPAAPAQE